MSSIRYGWPHLAWVYPHKKQSPIAVDGLMYFTVLELGLLRFALQQSYASHPLLNAISHAIGFRHYRSLIGSFGRSLSKQIARADKLVCFVIVYLSIYLLVSQYLFLVFSIC